MPIDARARKILMVLESNFPTAGGGGAEGQVRTISRYLRARGIDVQIIVPMTKEGPAQEHDTVDDVPVWRIPYPQLRFIGGCIMLTRLAAHLVRRRADYDVIHAHIAHNMAAVSCIVGRLLGKTVIVKLTGWLELRRGILAHGRRSPGMALKRAALKTAAFVQATSCEIRDRLVARGFAAERVHVIPNAVDTARFAPSPAVRERRRNTATPLTGIFVGRFVPEKSVVALVAAWMDAFAGGANVRLLLLGSGEQRAMLADMIRAQQRERQIKLLGPRSNVEHYLRQSHFGLLPSLYEGLSNTLLEYMAAGLPVLGTRISGTEDFIEPGESGWLVEAGNPAALCANLRTIGATDRATLARMGECARRQVRTRADIDAVIAQLAGLYAIPAMSVVHGGPRACAE